MSLPKRENPYYAAQAILSRRDHSVAELRQKLKKKNFTDEQVNQVLAYLQEKKFLSDERFAEMYVASILRAKAVGPRYLFLKLKQRGVEVSLIQKTLKEALPDNREKELLKQAIQAWRRRYPSRARDQARLYRFLMARGFTSASLGESLNDLPISEE